MLQGLTAFAERRMGPGPHGWAIRTAGTVVAGGIGWVVDVTLLWVLAVGVGIATPIAAGCGVIASGAINFVLNRAVHAGAGPRHRRELARYGALFAVNLIIVAATVPLVADQLGGVIADRGLALIAAKVVVTAVLLLFNGYAYHRWVFNRDG